MAKTRIITELPFGLSGRVYRTPMPFSTFDPDKIAFHELKENNVSMVIILAEEHEYIEQTGEDLKSFYIEEGLSVLHLPIVDFSIPNRADLDTVMDETMDYILNGKNIAVHCLAGIGRTGIFMAIMARRVFGFDGKEAILWVRQFIPDAVSNTAQIRFVIE